MDKISSYSGSLALKVAVYQKLGQQEAAKLRPATDATHPDTHEVALRSEADGLIAKEQRIVDALMAETDKASLEIQSKLTELKADIQHTLADNTLSGQVDASLSGEKAALVDAAAERIRREVAWKAFRAENGIREPAHYPESMVWHWAVIIALALLETIANAFFYENSNGLAGGLVVALSVAVVNMGSATLLGSGFRRRNLVSKDQRGLGWLCLLAFIPLTLFCNALFSAFRSAYQMLNDPQDLMQLREGFKIAQAEAIRFFIGDFQFKDLNSFLLFMTGLGLSILAFWKGYTSDDPFPGYSKRDRALKVAKEAEDKLRLRVKQQIKDLLHSQRLHVQRLAGETGTLVASVTRRLSECDLASRLLVSNGSSIQRDYHLVLDAYRQANLAIRGTAPPSYFSDRPDVSSVVKPAAAIGRMDELKSLLSSLESLQVQHRDELNSKQNELQQQMTQILSRVFDEFLNRVEAEAEVAVQRDIQIMPESLR